MSIHHYEYMFLLEISLFTSFFFFIYTFPFNFFLPFKKEREGDVSYLGWFRRQTYKLSNQAKLQIGNIAQLKENSIQNSQSQLFWPSTCEY